ncbi:MAG: DUF951 domain-containing protein [Acutalibacteraceae bacterium]|nr:DUF951 domain-containing protein [Acutalibacteraceae bacterium]
MDIKVGDRLLMKKNHPCGANTFTVTRIGMDFRLKCDGCGREVMVPRVKAEKSLKKIIKADGEE